MSSSSVYADDTVSNNAIDIIALFVAYDFNTNAVQELEKIKLRIFNQEFPYYVGLLVSLIQKIILLSINF